MSDTLTNCPFCGGHAELQVVWESHTKELQGANVRCTSCFVRPFPIYAGLEDERTLSKKAIDAWNRRAAQVEQPTLPINRADFTEQIVLGVAEIADRNSPEDQPEMMLVTCEELRNIIESAFERLDEESAAPPAPAPAPQQPESALTHKQAWWAGYRAGKGLPPDTPRQEALAAQVGEQAQPVAPDLRKVAEAVREAALLKMLELSRNGIPCKPAWNNIYGERAATVTDYMEAIRTMPVDPIIESVKGE